MKRIFLLFCCAAYLLNAASRPDAEAASILAKEAQKSRHFTNATGKTLFFSRAQLKYGLERDDYLHHWVDRPLYQDTALLKRGSGTFINDEAMKVTRQVLHDLYKMDGLAFFPSSSNRMDFFRSAALPGAPIAIVPELVSARFLVSLGVKPDLNKIVPEIEAALANKSTCRINGKILLTSYPEDTDPSYWAEVKKFLTEKYGDKFIIAPMHELPREILYKPVVSAADVRTLQDTIRAWLRKVDGYYYNTLPLNEYRRYDTEFNRQIIIPILHGILSEPEFRGKLLVWGTKVGHENFYAKGSFTYNCAGTDMLRRSIGDAVAAKADVIHMIEWDEQNENTSFRPTVYNSFSTQRIARYFSGLTKGRLFPPQPGDDVSIPNFIVSYKKILCAGETLEIEVVNVPEYGSTDKAYDFKLILRDISGKTVRRLSGKLAGNKLSEMRFNIKVADILDHHTVIPEIKINNKVYRGFSPVELRANYNGNNKWVKQPLRDLADCKVSLKIAGKTAVGMVKIVGKVTAKTPLHSVELLDGAAPVYVHNSVIPVQESEQKAVFSLIIGAYGNRNITFKGSLKPVNSKTLSFVNQRIGSKAPRGDNEYGSYFRNDGRELIFHGKKALSGYFNTMLFSIALDKKELDKAEVDVDLTATAPDGTSVQMVRQRIRLADIARKKMWAAAGKMGSHFLLYRSDVPHRIPEAVGKTSAGFTVLTDPRMPQSVYYVEIVDKNRKTFRSMPVTIYTPSGKTAEFSAFDFLDKKPIRVRCDKNLLTVSNFEISPEYGAAVKNSGGRAISGMMGVNSGLLNDLQLMESYGHGNLAERFFRSKHKNTISSVPELIRESDGKFSWKFSGNQNVSFPICTIYPYSGFELNVTFTPADVKKKQVILTSGHAGFTLYISDGILRGTFYNAAKLAGNPKCSVSGGRLAAGKKYNVAVKFNQKTMQIITNGKPHKSVPCSGYQLFPSELSIGHSARGEGFHGTISNIGLRPL